jgi:hypothetical protein
MTKCTSLVFCTVLNCTNTRYPLCFADAKKGGEEAAERAEELLHEMENLYNMGDQDVKPNKRTYCSVISKSIINLRRQR